MFEHPHIRFELARQRQADLLREAGVEHVAAEESRRRRASLVAGLRSLLARRPAERPVPDPRLG